MAGELPLDGQGSDRNLPEKHVGRYALHVSHSPDLVPKVPPSYWSSRKLLLLLLAGAGSAALAYFLLQLLPGRRMREWPVSQGRVTETRARVTHFLEGTMGTAVQQQAEILVTYTAAGHTYIRWFSLPPRSDLTRKQMNIKTAQLAGTICTVHWKAKHPLEAYVTAYSTN